MTRKKIIILSVICVAIFGYLFFNKTVRGSSLAMYTFGGLRAPISTKVSCAMETDKRVEKKFSLPLNLDKKSKDLLKNFWHYSYYKECLYRNGYDFKGNEIPASVVIQDNSNWVYTNKLANFQFFYPAPITIISDNTLNVDLDDQEYTSVLKIDGERITLSLYSKYEINSISELEDPAKRARLSKTSSALLAVTNTHVKQESEHEVIWVENKNTIEAVLRKENTTTLIQFSGSKDSRALIEKIIRSSQFID